MITLRDYQEEIIEKARSAFRNGKKAPILVLPTGAGKTICFSYMAKEAVKRGKKVMILVHRQELVYQTAEKLDFFGLEYGIISPEFPHNDSHVQIAMVQTLAKRLDKTEKPDLLIIDECHHSTSITYKTIILWANCLVLGVTATPCRLDGNGLGSIFDEIEVGITVQDLIDRKYLSDYKYYGFPVKKDLIKNMRVKMGEYTKETAESISTSVIGDVVGQWEEKSGKQPTIVFCSTVAGAENVAQKFLDAGYNFQSIDGKMDRNYRKSIIKGLADGTIQGVTSCDVISEGTDIPVAGCAILLRKTASTSLFLQQVGRVLRPVEDKTAVIIDMVANYQEHDSPSKERDWSLDSKVKSKKKKEDKEPVYMCEECYAIWEKEDGNICPECGWVVPDKKRKEMSVDVTLDYGLIDFSKSLKNQKLFQNSFKMYCRAIGKKDGFAYYTWKRWSSLGGATPDKATPDQWANAFSQEQEQRYGIASYIKFNLDLWKGFQLWQNQKVLSNTKS